MEDAALVLDPGTRRFKAGFAGNQAPHAIFRTLCARSPAHVEPFYGEDAWKKRGFSNPYCPIGEDGIVALWDDLEGLLHYTFYEELRVAPEEHSVLFTEQSTNAPENREKMAEMMFETYRIPSLHLANSAVLTLHASGLASGIVVDSGHKMTHIIPINNGAVLNQGVLHLDFAGENLTNFLRCDLAEHGYLFTTKPEHDMVSDMKAKFCYISQDFEESLLDSARSSTPLTTYELPDREVITFTDEIKFSVPEAIFRPSLLKYGSVDPSTPGIHQSIHDSIQKCETNVHRELYNRVVLSGGNTMFPGISARLQKELSLLAPLGTEIKIVAPPDRIYSSWIGGSMLASTPTFKSKWCSKQQYEEFGPSVVHRKFL